MPIQPQTIPVQVPINTGNGQTIYQTVNVPIQCFGNQFPQFVQPQMQIIPQLTQQVANVITPTGQIQQVHLANVPFLPQPLPAAASQHGLKPENNEPNASAPTNAQPITIANSQGQQIVIPTQILRSPQQTIQLNSNVPMPTIQHIPGIGNVQVISANALSASPFMAQPAVQSQQIVPQSSQHSSSASSSVATSIVSSVSITPTLHTQTTTSTASQFKAESSEVNTTPAKWLVKHSESPVILQVSSSSTTTPSMTVPLQSIASQSSSTTTTTQSQNTLQITAVPLTSSSIQTIKAETAIQPAPGE